MEITRILFVCHGNICRSPMAEFVFTDLMKKRGLASQFLVASAATSREEIGNPVHSGTIQKLRSCKIPMWDRRAVQMTRADYEEYDYLIGMDKQNLANMGRIAGVNDARKLHRLLEFSSAPRDIADPWYTGNFDETYDDITEGCMDLLGHILSVQETKARLDEIKRRN